LTANGGGIGGSGVVSRGSISAFGSIIVNGAEFDIANATIIVEGEEIGIGDDVALGNLDVGRVVTVYGTDGKSAVADRVTYNDDVEGPVESIRNIDTLTKELIVLGQAVVVNVITEFKGTTFDTIILSDVVEVSGFFDDTGAIRATFLEKTGDFSPGVAVEIEGYVENLDSDLEIFEINELTVDYSSADTSGLPGGVPANGLLVEIDGTLDASGGEMLAASVELEDDLDVEDADSIEVTGFVTDFVSAVEFTVGNQAVQTDVDILFVDGTAADIALGVKLQVEGSLVDDILLAKEIEFWDSDQIEVEGEVTAISSPTEFTVGSQVVQTDVGTVFEDGTPEEIVLGVKLEVKGVPIDIAQSVLVADKVAFEKE
jgi:hypothetical protein